MNPSTTQQLVGNLCIAFAALLFFVPLQFLLFDLRGKSMDGGGFFAAAILLLSLWILFVVGLALVTASGGFDWLGLSRWALHTLVTLAITGLLVYACIRFETRMPEPTLLQVVFVKWPIQIVPLLTMALLGLSLNPQWLPSIPRLWVQWSWIVIAAACLVFWAGLLAYQVTTRAVQTARALAHLTQGHSGLEEKNLAEVASIDPQTNFAGLMDMANSYKSDTVRQAAIDKLRGDSACITKLANLLESKKVDEALDVVSMATFSDDEKQKLALPVRSAMERVTQDTRNEFRYIARDRRKNMRKYVGRQFNEIATKFASTGVDFKPAIHAFEATFDDPKTTE